MAIFSRPAPARPSVLALLPLVVVPVAGLAPPADDPFDDEALAPPADSRPLEPAELDNLVALARVVGYVQGFHPSDGAERAPWPSVIAGAVAPVQEAADSPALRNVLEAALAPIAPAVRIYPEWEEPPPLPDAALPTGARSARVVRWAHGAVGILPSRREWARARRGSLPEGWRSPEDELRALLGVGLACSVPLTLWGDRRGGLPPSTAPGADGFDAEGRAGRLATVILAWNLFQHFHQGLDLDGGPSRAAWGGALRGALAGAARAGGRTELLGVLRDMVAVLGDGQATVEHGLERRSGRLPLVLEETADGVLVVGSSLEGAGPGDRVIAIGGLGVGPSDRGEVRLDDLLDGEVGSRVDLVLADPDGREREVIGTFLEGAAADPGTGAPPAVEPAPGVHYVHVDRLRRRELEDAAWLTGARSLVVDARGYGVGAVAELLRHLIREPIVFERLLLSRPGRPDGDPGSFEVLESRLEVARPRFDGRLLVLVDRRTSGPAESFAEAVRHHRLGTLVGSPTSGLRGDPGNARLPGGFELVWTARAVVDGDGRVAGALRPDVEVGPTPEGLRAGVDERLEHALGLAGD